MDLSEASTTVFLAAVLFALGYFAVFAYQVKLAFKKRLFKCGKCGNCCRLRIIEITKDDVDRLKKAGLRNFYEKKSGEYWMKRKNGRCIFLKDDLCSIHKIRPQICRDFPFFKKFGLEYCRTVSFCPSVEELKNA
jgi:Fe-S-cluster containining protein